MWTLEGTTEAGPVTFRIASDAVKTIGRSAGAQFFLDAPLVSRLHCQLTAVGPSLEVKDLDSTNGTFVNGRRITTSKLQSGDTLTVGRVDLKVFWI